MRALCRPHIRTGTPALPFCDLWLRSPKPHCRPIGYPREPKSWGERFRQRRMDLGLTQDELAKRPGRTGRAVADWESGKTRPLASSRVGIAQVLGEQLLPREAEIGSRLRVARWRQGLTQADLAVAVGLDVRTIRNVERAVHRPSPRTLALLGCVLGTEPAGDVCSPI